MLVNQIINLSRKEHITHCYRWLISELPKVIKSAQLDSGFALYVQKFLLVTLWLSFIANSTVPFLNVVTSIAQKCDYCSE